MEDLSGKQFGPYEIVAPLGEGGMAAVYRAYQPAMERYVALKVLPRRYADDPTFTARFHREARLLAQLQHPHILPVFDYGQSEGYTYIVMPFIQSGTLMASLKGQPLPLGRIRQVVSQLGDALHYAHAHALIHRDVKPSNVLLDEGENCLLTDFGLARIVEASANLTTAGTILGTPAYMSPEQGSGKRIDARSDIYSLGVILYEMATGRVPYKAETPVAVILKHIQDPLPPARSLNPELPEAVERVMLKALSKRPEDRYQTASDMVRAIQAAIQDVPTVVVAEERFTHPPAVGRSPTLEHQPPQLQGPILPARQRSTVPRRALAASSIVLMLAIVGGLLTVYGGPPKPSTGDASQAGETIPSTILPGALQPSITSNPISTPSSLGNFSTPPASTAPLPNPTVGTSQVPNPTSIHTFTTLPAQVATETATRGTLLFKADFENGSSNGFRDLVGLWRAVRDETGNWVYEIDNKGKNQWAHSMFGSSSWLSYVIEYRIRLLHFSDSPNIGAQIGFRSAASDNLWHAYYDLSLVPSNQGLWLGYGDDTAKNYRLLASTDYHIETNKWYKIRIEIIGTSISVFVNGNEELAAYDSELASGSFGLRVGPDMQVQYDDILITEIAQ